VRRLKGRNGKERRWNPFELHPKREEGTPIVMAPWMGNAKEGTRNDWTATRKKDMCGGESRG